MDSAADVFRAVASLLVIAMAAYAYGLAAFGRRDAIPPPATPRLYFTLLVPCLNEAEVIGRTLSSLTSLRGRFHIGRF